MPTNPWRHLDVGMWLDFGDAPHRAPGDFSAAFAEMARLEAGAVANADEGRQVGHYWLRTPGIAPEGYGEEIVRIREVCRELAAAIHREGALRTVLVLGIGGSALGPQLVADALGEPDDRMAIRFLDNTDPDGMARTLGSLDLRETLVLCISKSGGTPETRNALIETKAAFERAELPFAPQAIAITGEGSQLWNDAADWRARVPMWDWIGGRTSVTSAVGLLPAFLQGIDVDGLLEGAAALDALTRIPDAEANPAARLAWAWYALSGGGRNTRAMVMLPYRDRLVLLSKYLQQLVMESVGKRLDRDGKEVHVGLTVYGNKGSTDQHAYVQQLRDGPDDHFVTFIQVLDDGWYGACDVEPGIDAGDTLQGLYLGTRRALREAGHPSITLTLHTLDAYRLGAVIALYERAVGLFAELVNVNAYHQPGVEAGKKAAAAVLTLKPKLLAALAEGPGTATELTARAGAEGESALTAAHNLLWRLAVNERGVAVTPGETAEKDIFSSRG
ncbi:glucose-6-phosphate isomerase [Deltaproteobacteria bacterium]|nr:glucose-6-phosphate isomerase [Deltaproteobacteria bacterium]